MHRLFFPGPTLYDCRSMDDLSPATKAFLEKMQLSLEERMATKDDLRSLEERMATKVDLDSLQKEMDRRFDSAYDDATRILVLVGKIDDKLTAKVDNHERRIKKLEKVAA